MNNYSEKFEKMRIAGKLAAQTLDMLTDNIKEGISTPFASAQKLLDFYHTSLLGKSEITNATLDDKG